MVKHPVLAAEERSESRNQSRRLPERLVSANLFGAEQQTLSLEVNRLELQRAVANGAENAIVLLSVGSRTAVRALIRHVQYHRVSGRIMHLDFYLVGAPEVTGIQV